MHSETFSPTMPKSATENSVKNDPASQGTMFKGANSTKKIKKGPILSRLMVFAYSKTRAINTPLHKILLVVHDVLITGLAMFISLSMLSRIYDISKISDNFVTGGIIILLSYLFFGIEYDLYKYQIVLNRARQTVSLFKALFSSLLLLIFVAYISQSIDLASSRILLGLIYTNIFLISLLTRVVFIPMLFNRLVRGHFINRNLLIIGLGEDSQERAKSIVESRQSNFNIVGFVDDEEGTSSDSLEGLPVLGGIKDLKKVIKENKINDILISSNYKSNDKLYEVIDICKSTNRTVHIASEQYNIVTEKLEIEEIGMVSSFRLQPTTSKKVYRFSKRVMDIMGAGLIVLMLLPVWIFLALLIKIDSKGPLFYMAKVIGKNGEIFEMFKFRSMRQNASTKLHEDKVVQMIQNNETTTKIQNDPRITKVGAVLRKLSLDEFPQLLNVLKGDMSLVGPRPCLPYEFEHMNDWQKKRSSVTPGMTGLWQIKGRDEVLFNDQIVLDLYYIEHRTLKLDIQILLSTIPVVLFGKGGL